MTYMAVTSKVSQIYKKKKKLRIRSVAPTSALFFKWDKRDKRTFNKKFPTNLWRKKYHSSKYECTNAHTPTSQVYTSYASQIHSIIPHSRWEKRKCDNKLHSEVILLHQQARSDRQNGLVIQRPGFGELFSFKVQSRNYRCS